MHPAQQTIPSPKEVIRILIVHAKRWLIPTAVVSLLAVGYALVRLDTWEASQALIVRNEAANNELGPGKFGHADEMKAFQETILELVGSRSVLDVALKEIGPPTDYKKNKAAWPTARDIEDVRKTIKLAPPKGAEFGTTEVFYLRVRDRSRDRAIAMNRTVYDQLQARFQELRDAKALSMIDELAKTVHLAKADLAESTTRLAVIEKEVGSDLAELRVLSKAGSGGESALRRTMTEIRSELRQLGATQKANQHSLALLKEAEADPGRLVAMPNQLLESQSALRRLKNGLVDAQLRTAGLKGTMADEHPRVQSAKQSEEEIGRHLHNELAIAIRGLEVEMRSNADRQALLQDRLAETTERLGRLAELRAAYSGHVAETAHRTALVERAEQNLAEARAAHASAKATSLISRIDAPDAGTNPVGPSRAIVVLIGLVGGLLTGFGILFLTVQPAQPNARDPEPSREPTPSIPPMQVALNSIEPTFQPGSSLSFNQALQKIEHSNTV